MIDLGISKLALIGMMAPVVIGPKRLPKVARTTGALFGHAQRYIADVKAEVSREIELEELCKMRTDFEQAARSVEQTIHQEVNKHATEVSERLNKALSGPTQTSASAPGWRPAPGKSRNGRSSQRNEQLSMPEWYRQERGVHIWIQLGAAHAKRHHPPVVAAQPRARPFLK